MATNFMLYMGIDLSIGPKPVTFVAINPERELTTIGEGDLGDVLSFAAGTQMKVLVGVTCPARPNNARMADAQVRATLSPPPEKGKWRALRQAEYELISRGATIPSTPGSAEHSLPWMKRGFLLVQWLEKLSYRPFSTQPTASENPPARQWMEVPPDVAFWSLLGTNPLESGTLEGRIQRQLALEDLKLAVPDAMEFFEEITRYKLLKGNLPMKYVLPQAEINAWVAAYTAWLADRHSNQVRAYGAEEEGLLFVPLK